MQIHQGRSVSEAYATTLRADVRWATPPKSPSVGHSPVPDHLPQEVAEAPDMDLTTQSVFKMQKGILRVYKNTHQLSDESGTPLPHDRPVSLIQRWGLKPRLMTSWVF